MDLIDAVAAIMGRRFAETSASIGDEYHTVRTALAFAKPDSDPEAVRVLKDRHTALWAAGHRPWPWGGSTAGDDPTADDVPPLPAPR